MGRKADRLDDAFLFALSSIGLLISFIQIRQQNLDALVEAIPFLLLGILFPFIIGYIRGAMEKDSLSERVRGWIYFVVGTMSYFAFHVSSLLRTIYSHFTLVDSQIVLFGVLIFGVLIVLSLIKWVRKVFRRTLNQYAISGTTVSAFTIAFVLTLAVSMYHDYSGKDILGILSTNPTELIFWISIILSGSLIALILEKASAEAAEYTLPLPKSPKKFEKITNFFLVKGISLVTTLLEYSFDYNLKARLLWLLSYVLWFLGSMFWIAHVSFVPPVFYILTVLIASTAGVIFYRTKKIEFAGLEARTPSKLSFCLLVFVLVFPMILTGGFSLSIVLALLLLTIFSAFLEFHQPKHRP
jgi:hypothetical protein